MVRYSICVILISITHWCWGQTAFEVTREPFGERTTSGLPMAIEDLNGDYLNDVVFLRDGHDVYIAYQQPLGGFDLKYIGPTNAKEQWAMVIGDLDRDGYRDIVVCGAYDFIWIFYQDENGFNRRTIPIPDIYPQGTNLVDINNDGWLDIFVCNDVGPNVIWWNREGDLERDTSDLFNILAPDDSPGNYSSEWCDVDLDGDLDLYVTKCHPDAMTPMDPRRINQLFINQGGGQFTEEADLRGVNSGEQGWTGHWYDADNDGDFDLLVSNHNTWAQFYRNDGNGQFEDLTIATGLRIGGPVIQCLARDFDLDGHQDIVVGGFPHYFYYGRQNIGYQRQFNHLGFYNHTSLTVGDLDRNGHPDIFGNIGNLINKTSSMSDQLLLHPATRNNYLKVYLKGVESNPDGVGGMISAYHNGESRSLLVQAGEGYGIHTSFEKVIGLGDISRIDSVCVQWPSGTRQCIENLEVNQYVMFWEGEWAIAQADINLPESIEVCHDDSVELRCTHPLFDSWSNGRQENSIWVNRPDYIQPILRNDQGEKIYLPGISIVFDREVEGSIVFKENDTLGCEDYVVIDVSVKPLDLPYIWEDGSTGPRRVESGTAVLAYGITACDTILLDQQFIQLGTEPELVNIQTDTVGQNQEMECIAEFNQGQSHWYSDPVGVNLIHVGDTLRQFGIQMDTSFFVRSLWIERGAVHQVMGPMIDLSKGAYPASNSNTGLRFRALARAVLERVWVYTDVEGVRRFELEDQSGQIVGYKDVMLESDNWQPIDLKFSFDPENGIYVLRTNDSVNVANLGHRSPRLLGWNGAPMYPYEAQGVGQILESTNGYDEYPAFWDWQVRPMGDSCWSRMEEVSVIYNPTVPGRDLKGVSVQYFPNPTKGMIYIQLGGTDPSLRTHVHLYDMHGKECGVPVKFIRKDVISMDLTRLSEGIYWIRYGEWAGKVVVVP